MMKIRSRVLAAIASVCLLYLNAGSVAMGGTLLPPGEQTFFDNNGLPLSSGCVYFYVPGTTTPKATYLNSGQTIANTNPVQLDAAGRAIIYGTGTYRQIVTSTGPNSGSPCSPAGATIWDQLTASTDSSATIFAGASSGTPNAITVVASAFSGADGQVINYISTNTNTGPATFNPSGFGAVPIVRDSSIGPQALTGGELVATNAVSLIYDATAGTFHILSPVTWPAQGSVPVGTVVPFPGFTAPSGYAFAYGQAVSRSTYAALLGVLTSAQTATLSSGSPTITGLSDTTQFALGQPIESTGIPAGATIQSCTSTACTLSANATTTRTGTVTVFPYGNGDGATTFNLPNYQGVGLVGRDNMGGTAGNIMQASPTITTTNASPSATLSSAVGVAVGMTVISTNVPAGTTITALSGTSVTLSANATATAVATPSRISQFADAQGLNSAGGSRAKSLLASELPANIPNSAVTTFPGTQYVGTGINGSTLNPGGTNVPVTTSAPSATTTVTINATGGNAFGNMIPNRITNWAVRLTP